MHKLNFLFACFCNLLQLWRLGRKAKTRRKEKTLQVESQIEKEGQWQPTWEQLHLWSTTEAVLAGWRSDSYKAGPSSHLCCPAAKGVISLSWKTSWGSSCLYEISPCSFGANLNFQVYILDSLPYSFSKMLDDSSKYLYLFKKSVPKRDKS